jgi:putative CocE/NonD family hydrolase
MSLATRALGRMYGLGPAQTRRIKVERDVPIPMPDGALLLAERMYPDVPDVHRLPILLCRTPYGRSGLASALTRLVAERGYQAVKVSVRGTFGSGGEWVPFRNEQRDGRAVLACLAEQPWFSGRVGGMSPSYCGLTQWAVVEDAPEWFQAWAPGMTASDFHRLVYPQDGVFSLESLLVWTSGLANQARHASFPRRVLAVTGGMRRVGAAAATLPVVDADVALTGKRVEYLRDMLTHDGADDPWWQPLDFGKRLETVPPATMVSGWYDVFVAAQLDDYKALRAAGRDVRLTVGPWTHAGRGGSNMLMRDMLEWMDIHLRDAERPRVDTPVRVHVMGSGSWLDLADWPPPSTPVRWHLQAGGGLSPELPSESTPSAYRYDPADPTPSVGGASLHPRNCGPKDNRVLEARPDLLVFSSEPMADDLTVVGEISLTLFARSSLEHTDFVARLCDVSPEGRSVNLTDGILRVRPGQVQPASDGTLQLTVTLAPTANTFRRGHRIRLQVSSGAHPRYSRNPGTGEPLAKATRLLAADQQVLHDPAHPSSLQLPLYA